MSYESYCAACTYMNENQNCGKYYCTMKGGWRKASDPKCYNFIEAYSRSNSGRENMYEYSSRYYITTAILSIVKALDNNHQLDIIKDFTENILKKDPKYFPILFAYEIIGPQIAKKLHEDKNKIRVATTMFYLYIKPTVAAIQNKETEKAIEIYKSMTIELAKIYNINTNLFLPDPSHINIISLYQAKKRKRALA